MSSLDTTGTGSGSTVFHRCLFCHAPSPSQDSNTTHMFRAHGFLIPHQSHLLIDLETLLTYLETIVEDDAQCIHCFTQRTSGEAARQHMMAKGHCLLDLASDGSEYLEFYDFDDERSEEGEEQGEEVDRKGLVQLDDDAVRLPSGKVTSHRKARPRPAARRRERDSASPAAIARAEASPPLSDDDSPDTSSSRGLTRPLANVDPLALPSHHPLTINTTTTTTINTPTLPSPPSRHDLAIASMRHSDRTALAHLPAAQQRSLLATQRQQAAASERAQQSQQASLGAKGNKTLMKFFKPRVPKRKGGLHRESLRA